MSEKVPDRSAEVHPEQTKLWSLVDLAVNSVTVTKFRLIWNCHYKQHRMHDHQITIKFHYLSLISIRFAGFPSSFVDRDQMSLLNSKNSTKGVITSLIYWSFVKTYTTLLSLAKKCENSSTNCADWGLYLYLQIRKLTQVVYLLHLPDWISNMHIIFIFSFAAGTWRVGFQPLIC